MESPIANRQPTDRRREVIAKENGHDGKPENNQEAQTSHLRQSPVRWWALSGPHFRLGMVVFLLSVLISRPLQADPSSEELLRIEQLQNTLATVADAVRPSVVAIRTQRRIPILEENDSRTSQPTESENKQERMVPAVGSGFIIRGDGQILTNEHVVADAEPEDIVVVLSGGESFSVQTVITDPRSDLALLQIDAKNLKAAVLGNVATVKQGHFVIAMGNPFGAASAGNGEPAMSFGVISLLGQNLTRKLDPSYRREYSNLIQTDARINPGNSGGPLLNLKGEVIGIIAAISTRSGASEGVGYAIPMDQRTHEIVDDLLKGEPVDYAFLGIRLRMPTQTDRDTCGGPSTGGTVIEEVEPNTPAAQADLRAGDLIVELAGQSVRDSEHLVRMVGSAKIGKPITLTVHRGKNRLLATVTPISREVIRGVRLEAAYNWRGMKLSPVTPRICEQFSLANGTEGLVITEINPTSPAAEAGLRLGMIVRQLGDQPIASVGQFRELTADATGPLKLLIATHPPIEYTIPSDTTEP